MTEDLIIPAKNDYDLIHNRNVLSNKLSEDGGLHYFTKDDYDMAVDAEEYTLTPSEAFAYRYTLSLEHKLDHIGSDSDTIYPKDEQMINQIMDNYIIKGLTMLNENKLYKLYKL